MKKITLIAVVILATLCLKSFGQKLEDNKVDDFTKSVIKNTSWETAYATMSTTAYFRVSKIDAGEFFDWRYMDGDVFSIDKDEELLFKLDNDEIITLKNIKYAITCRGCGSTGRFGTNMEGISISCVLHAEEIEKLKAHKVVKVRFHTSKGYYEHEIKDKVGEKLQKCLALVE